MVTQPWLNEKPENSDLFFMLEPRKKPKSKQNYAENTFISELFIPVSNHFLAPAPTSLMVR